MSIVSTVELWDSRSGEQSWKGVVKYARKFRVVCSDNTDHTTTILSSGSIPSRLQSHPSNAFALVESRKVSNDPADPRQYLVDVSYTSQFDQDPASTNEDPLSRPAIWSFSFERATKAVREDLDGNALDNSAGVPFDPPVEVETSIPIIKIDINKASFSYASIATLQDCVNDATWNGFAAGTVKVRGVEVKQQFENNQLYWSYSWTLAVKWDGWQAKILDQGFHELDDDGEPKLIRDAFGNPLPHPSRLDGDGNKLESGEPSVFLDFTTCRTANFSTVPIP